jgi:anthranilate phosphoribosyltransferase
VRAPRIPGAAANGAAEDDDTGPALDHAAVAKAAAEAGLAALAGEPGATRDSLIYGAALCLWHVGRHGSLKSAAEAARGVLDRGEALDRLQRMRRTAR